MCEQNPKEEKKKAISKDKKKYNREYYNNVRKYTPKLNEYSKDNSLKIVNIETGIFVIEF